MKKLLLLLALMSQPLIASTSLTFSGQGYITQGQEYHFNTTNSNIVVQINNSSTDDITFSVITPEYTHWWFICFRPADGQKLKVGLYADALRWHTGEDDRHTFDIFGDGRGSNYVTGWFEVLEIEWNPEHTKLLTFAANFHHLSEGMESRYTDGTVLYNATVPEMSSLGLILLSGLGLIRRSRR